MLRTRRLARLVALLDQAGKTIVVTGDAKQLTGVNTGGLSAAVDLRSGQAAEAVARMDDNGSIVTDAGPSTSRHSSHRPILAVAARHNGIIEADISIGLSLSMTHKAAGFDRKMPAIDFDAIEHQPTDH